MRRLIALVLLAGVVTACSSSGGPSASPDTTSTTKSRCTGTTEAGLERIDITVGGTQRHAYVHLPAGWNGKSPVPVVLSFHGLGTNALQQLSTDGFVARSDQEGFIVVHPDAGGTLGALGAAWDLKGNGDVEYVSALLDDLEQRACVDASRVYATGLSYGGAMTDVLACRMSDRIAAAAPVSAYLPKLPCQPARPVPTLSFHGVEDHLLPYDGGGTSQQVAFETWGAEWAKRNGCSGTATEVKYTASVDELRYSGCKEPVVLYRVHDNGHTWPGHPLPLDRDTMVDFFAGKTTGQPYPLMVALGLTPEEFADTITLANQDIDASDMILSFFQQHQLPNR